MQNKKTRNHDKIKKPSTKIWMKTMLTVLMFTKTEPKSITNQSDSN